MTTIYEIRVYRIKLNDIDAKLERMGYDDIAKITRNGYGTRIDIVPVHVCA